MAASFNPFNALLEECDDDAAQIQQRYERHRTERNESKKQELLGANFEGFSVDPILRKLIDDEPGYADPRDCLTLWARPQQHIRDLIGYVQSQLELVAPNLWMMPPDNLHMTAMEISHSKTAAEIDELQQSITHAKERATDYTFEHRCRLVKPYISFDASALALSFLPAVSEPLGTSRSKDGDASYTYHHLRRDLWDVCKENGLDVGSRYVVPSAHLTIARFVSQEGFKTSSDDGEGTLDVRAVAAIIQKIDELNEELRDRYWSTDEGQAEMSGDFWVGEEKGLEMRKGKLWYGGGESIRVGKGY